MSKKLQEGVQTPMTIKHLLEEMEKYKNILLDDMEEETGLNMQEDVLRYITVDFTKYAVYDNKTNEYITDDNGDIKLMSQTDANCMCADLNSMEPEEDTLED